jgi:PleD family two-component response regulator
MMIINKTTTFLVVDDFEPMRKVTAGQLRAMGASTIVTASNGVDALRILKNSRVDVVLSDWNMPVMTGLELLKEIRADEKLSHLPFIMITAEADREHITEAIANGVNDLLVKPYTSDSLSTRVEKVLKSPHQANFPARAKSNLIKREIALLEVPVGQVAELGKTGTGELVHPTILVVDDTVDNLLLLSHLFNDEYRVRISHTGEKALAICQSNNPPDLVLLDIMMPGMDGFEVAKRMREHPTSASIPVIFVTAMTDENARLKGLELGAIDFVTKPIDPTVLKLRVHNFMRYVELHKQLQATYDDMLELAHLRENVELITRHDMKGALAGVIGLVQGLAGDNSMNHKHVEQLRMAEESALQVLDMINLSSELLMIETGHFKLEAKQVNISEILHRIVEISRTSFAAKRLIVSIDTDMSVGEEVPNALGDAMLCYSLFQNLIKNACEAAPEKSRVTVVLYDETPLRILIQNKGAVPDEIRGRFFDKFVTYGKHGGTGLGTYSAKLLTEAQNGTISMAVSAQENKTTITVTLPLYEETPV